MMTLPYITHNDKKKKKNDEGKIIVSPNQNSNFNPN